VTVRDNRRVRVTVAGRVQGVFFRAATQDKARSLGLAGCVRNLPDGRVELLAEGPDAAVCELIAWCRVGPRLARVDRFEVLEEEPTGEWAGFSVLL